ncbi:DUF2470 domain-containing protein [Modestobacter sp. I12A-02628]|uniref:DUF2470 domain-containing protein n=1 Tax=Goekera deserti TaxID=2497753 RepID=A0A7K3WE42_9ACTN|nr:DUF2470 domain-containing protein [Goekera deserti]MPQ99616.1 DUF2470 domain-containing protein [Goekera deserti]NDI46374.1 DUF2470 domain-containing protein [Goekera deserti]NEL54694.1 DUF2470 domain-containing protein [Goekera deserti]
MTRSVVPPAVRPTAAERARTVSRRPSAAVCAAGISGSRVLAHTTTADGRVLLVVPTDGELAQAVLGSADGDLAALLMVTDHAPVTLRDPVRAQLWLSGWLAPLHPATQQEALLAFADAYPAGALLDVGRTATLLRLDLAEVVLGEDGHTAEITPEEFAAAVPDPLVAVEAGCLQHLDADHPDQLALFRSRIPGDWLTDGDVVRPLGLDRWGLRLRIERPRGHTDVRLPFPAPVADVQELKPAMARLLCAARRC